MFNFGQLEDRLNSDPAFRKQFFDDPAGTLRMQGVLLSFSQESALRIFAKLKRPPAAGIRFSADAVLEWLGS